MHRRALLKNAAAVASIGTAALTAGCQSNDDRATATGSRDAAADPTTSSSCDADRFGVGEVEVPEEVTPETATDVALFVEEAYAKDRAEAEGWNVSGVDYTNSTVETADVGFHTRAAVSLDVVESAERADGTATTLVGSLFYQGWYHVTESRVERASGRTDDPPEDGWTTVACA